ncbi:MAG: hypothetical protein K2K00_05545 [Muribaculaceae bacterium]|nr:hypothetical protein [Muribaculaceae bacterium]
MNLSPTSKLLPACVASLTVAMVIALSSCNTSGCTENRNAVPLAAFLNPATDSSITLDSLSIYGIGQPADSILSPAGSSVSQVYLPMRPTNSSVRWCIAYKWKELDYPQLNDTITFAYTSTPVFASEECGAYYRYLITEMNYTGHLIDRVEIVDSLITNVDKVYLNIYFKVDDKE